MAKRKTLTPAEKKAKGLKLAEKHGNTILSAVSRLSKCAQKYEYDSKTQEAIFSAVNAALKRCVDSFAGKKTEAEGLKLA